MLSSNKVWEKRLISGLSQAGTAWLRKSSRYDSRNFWAGLGGPSTSSRLRLKTEQEWFIFDFSSNIGVRLETGAHLLFYVCIELFHHLGRVNI